MAAVAAAGFHSVVPVGERVFGGVPVIAGGGGSSGGGSSGSGTSTSSGSSTTQQTGTTQTNLSSNLQQTQAINFSPTLVNTQTQAQAQAQVQQQQQQQQQRQQGLDGHVTAVVPQPAALLLAALGLPALFVLCRKKRVAVAGS